MEAFSAAQTAEAQCDHIKIVRLSIAHQLFVMVSVACLIVHCKETSCAFILTLIQTSTISVAEPTIGEELKLLFVLAAVELFFRLVSMRHVAYIRKNGCPIAPDIRIDGKILF